MTRFVLSLVWLALLAGAAHAQPKKLNVPYHRQDEANGDNAPGKCGADLP